MADTDLRDSPSTAADDSTPAAREAAPVASEGTPVSQEAHPSSEQTTETPDPREQIRALLDDLPDDLLGQLTEEHPRLRSTFDQRTRTLLQKKEAERQAEEHRREAAEARQREQDELERAFDLALSEDDDIDPLERDKAIRRVKEHRRFQQVQQAVLRDPGVQAWSVQQAGMQIAVQAQQHPELSGLWADAKADEAPDFADLAWRLARTYADRRLAELEPAIRADERTRRLRAEPNPDVLRSAPLPEGPRGLTLERYQAMLRRNDPELKKIPAAEIDALSASILGGA